MVSRDHSFEGEKTAEFHDASGLFKVRLPIVEVSSAKFAQPTLCILG